MRKEISIRVRRALFRMERVPAEGAPEKTVASVHRRFRDRQELPPRSRYARLGIELGFGIFGKRWAANELSKKKGRLRHLAKSIRKAL
jgi:hypothetical protein